MAYQLEEDAHICTKIWRRKVSHVSKYDQQLCKNESVEMEPESKTIQQPSTTLNMNSSSTFREIFEISG